MCDSFRVCGCIQAISPAVHVRFVVHNHLTQCRHTFQHPGRLHIHNNMPTCAHTPLVSHNLASLYIHMLGLAWQRNDPTQPELTRSTLFHAVHCFLCTGCMSVVLLVSLPVLPHSMTPLLQFWGHMGRVRGAGCQVHTPQTCLLTSAQTLNRQAAALGSTSTMLFALPQSCQYACTWQGALQCHCRRFYLSTSHLLSSHSDMQPWAFLQSNDGLIVNGCIVFSFQHPFG